MAFVLPANGPSTALDVRDIMNAALDDDLGTRMVVEPLGGRRKKGLDHEEFGMVSETHSGTRLLTLTITSFVEEKGNGEYMHALTLPCSCPAELGLLEVDGLFRKAF